ncbi:MAG: MBL fold metallo-hydrolase [Planctomycetes bacterium]|nr:MBL fold metallo-hydrolase [Planctomycetota bacterium]
MPRQLRFGLLVAILFTGACRSGPHSKIGIDSQEGNNAPRTRVVLLGTGTPNADPEHSGPAVAIVVDDTAYLVDCGPGVVRRAAAAYEKGIAALEPSKLRLLYVSHLHSDHTVGLPDLLLTPWVLGRDAPLVVYGPVGIKNMTDHIEQAYEEDIHMRIDGLERLTKRVSVNDPCSRDQGWTWRSADGQTDIG